MSSRPFRSLLVVLVAVGGLAACNSTPSARRVALDTIETLDNLTETERECMRERVETYSQDEVEAFAEGSAEDPPDADAQAALDKFEADLESCVTSN